jgi:hypothetical protein
VAAGGKKRILHGVFRIFLIVENGVGHADESLVRT